jgi:hypothetical protein
VHSHSLDAFRLEPDDGAPEDSFLVTDGSRTVLLGPRGVLAGPVFARLDMDRGSSVASHRFRYEHGRFTAAPTDASDPPDVTMPAASRPNALRRGRYGWWEMRNEYDAVVARWYQGPARPARVSGAHSVGRHRHRWAAGSDLVPPPQVWRYLTARDEAGSQLLRTADRASAQRVLDAVGAELAERLVELGRRIPVGDGSHEVEEAFAELRLAIAPVLSAVTSERLLDGIAGTVWSAVECQVLAARHTERERGASLVLRTTPLPYPRTDAGDLRARIFTEMQEMFLRLGRVAEACADPDVAIPPQTVELANAQGWEGQLGRLGGRALRGAMVAASADRGNDLRADHIRAWGVPHMGDPAGRWRTLSLQLDVHTGPRQGAVCRTARGCLIILQGTGSGSGDRPALEYAADGVFGSPPFGRVVAQRVCRGWGGTDRVATWLRLLDEHGPAPWPTASIEELAEATDMSVERATLLAFGFEPRDAYLVRRGGSGLSASLLAASGLDERRVADAGARLAREATIEDRLEVPDLLMPDDPADLWAGRLAVERAANWWNARGGDA